VVFVHAALLSIESIAIELLTVRLGLSPLAIAGNSILIAGAALVAISATTKKRETLSIFRDWKYLVPASSLVALGVYFWYDSVANVGASKEGLLSGPLEVVVILILARLILGEKLGQIQTLGAAIALTGFFAAVASATTTELLFTWGDIEAVISALAFGTGVIFLTRLTAKHTTMLVTGASLLISGVILAAILWTAAPEVTLLDWTVLLAFSIVPLLAALSYVIGLAKIGASVTSTIASFSILLTILFQLVLLLNGVDVLLPSNVPLAVIGGSLGVLGIYLIHRKENRLL
jgi:drug/metabolite transporter (DMT)-like permease